MFIEVDVVYDGKHQFQQLDLRTEDHGHRVIRIFAHPTIVTLAYDPDAEIKTLAGPFERKGKKTVSAYPKRWEGSPAPEDQPFYIHIMTQRDFFEFRSSTPGEAKAFQNRFYRHFPEGYPGPA